MRCLKGMLQGSEFVSEMGEQIHIPNYYSPIQTSCFVLLDTFNCIKRIVYIKEK